MTRCFLITGLVVVSVSCAACERDAPQEETSSKSQVASHDRTAHRTDADHGQDHPEREGPGHAAPEPGHDQDSGHHDEVELGSVLIGDLKVAFSQEHGKVAPGQEGHLVVKLPYNDKGATIVRAWIGTEDRTLSFVGRGEYAPSHNDYDVHAMAPDPLPDQTLWWVEITRPDGTRTVGSVDPLVD